MILQNCFLALLVPASATSVQAGALVCTWDRGQTGSPGWILSTNRGQTCLLIPPWEAPSDPQIIQGEDDLGPWKGHSLRGPAGEILRVCVHDGSDFCVVQMDLEGDAKGARSIDVLRFPRVRAVPNPSESPLAILGCAGLGESASPQESYTFMAAAAPQTRQGVVAGWITQERASGIVKSVPRENGVDMEPRLEAGGRLSIIPGELFHSDRLAIGLFDDVLTGLEAYADLMAKANRIQLPSRIPSGYCTWYHAGAASERAMAETARFCQDKHLLDFGLECLQIDDGWQVGPRDFTDHRPQGPYPKGMAETSRVIRDAGFTPGLWIIPFGWDRNAPALKEHPDWFVHRLDGQIYDVFWAGDCLDMTHPQAQDFLREVVSRITRDWGYRYLKIDGLWSGMAVKILYPESSFRPDGLGDALFHDATQTNIQAYRTGLKLVREAAGEGVYILGCNIAQNMRTLGASVGLVDGMRIGRDIGPKWDQIAPCAAIGSSLYFLHGKVWYNDPDCLMVREPLSLDQARAWGTWIGVTGQMNLVSEWLGGLPAERLDVVKRTLPNHGMLAQPLDLFDRKIPSVWRLPIRRAGIEWVVLGLFNWSESDPLELDLSLQDLGVATGPVVGFDFWEDAFVAQDSDRIRVTLPPSSCKALALQPRADRPQLVSTSRHVTQGAVDLVSASWDATDRAMKGTSQVVAGDPYEIRLLCPERWRVKSARALNGVTATVKAEAPRVRVVLDSPNTEQVDWEIRFKKPR